MRYIPQFTRDQLIQKIKHWSPSQISAISSCKFKWACRYLYDAPSKKQFGQNLKIGIYLHDMVKKASCAPDPKQILNRSEMIQYLMDNVEPLKSFGLENYPELIDVFLNTYCLYDFDNENTELPIGGVLPGMRLHCKGFVDYIHPKEGIVDLKIKGYVEKNRNKEPVYTESEFIQQGTYSYFLGIPRTQLNIMYIQKSKKHGKVQFLKTFHEYTKRDYEVIHEYVRLNLHEMFSGHYPPNRNYRWCDSFMCEYWDYCHRMWPLGQPCNGGDDESS